MFLPLSGAVASAQSLRGATLEGATQGAADGTGTTLPLTEQSSTARTGGLLHGPEDADTLHNTKGLAGQVVGQPSAVQRELHRVADGVEREPGDVHLQLGDRRGVLRGWRNARDRDPERHGRGSGVGRAERDAIGTDETWRCREGQGGGIARRG